MAKRVVDEASLTAVADAIRDRAGTTEAISFPDGFVSAVEGIPDYLALRAQNKLTEYSSKNVTSVNNQAFASASALTSIHLPNVTYLGTSAFENCKGLTSVEFPKVTYLNWTVFKNCTNLQRVVFGTTTTIDAGVFEGCTSLSVLILRGPSVCTLPQSWSFVGTPIAQGTGYIYVPRALLSDSDATKDYRRATNWSTFASQIRAIEDYPEITGGAT